LAPAPPATPLGAASFCQRELDGHSFDLSPLGKTEISTTTDENGDHFTYRLKICGEVAESCPGDDPGHVTRGTAVQSGPGTCEILSVWNSDVQWELLDSSNPGTGGIKLTLSNGDPCDGVPRTLVINIACDESQAVPAPGTWTTYNQNVPGACTYNMHIKSNTGCAVAGGGGMGLATAFCLAVLVTTIVYCAGGMVYRHQTYGAAWGSQESVPHLDFWRELPGLVADGVAWTRARATGLAGRYVGGGTGDSLMGDEGMPGDLSPAEVAAMQRQDEGEYGSSGGGGSGNYSEI
jgi:hypothetical protein